MMSEKRRDLYAGGLIIVLGAGTAIIGATYKLGSLTAMGPGYFPAALGVLLAFMGVIIAFNAFTGKLEPAPKVDDQHHGFAENFDWRGWGCIIGSVLLFMLFAEFVGLLTASFFSVFVACWGDRDAKFTESLLLPLGITVLGSLLFSFLLHVQIPATREGPIPLLALGTIVGLFVWNMYRKIRSLSALVQGLANLAAAVVFTLAIYFLTHLLILLLSSLFHWGLAGLPALSTILALHYVGVVMLVLQLVTEKYLQNKNAVIGTSIYAVAFFLYFCVASLKLNGGA